MLLLALMLASSPPVHAHGAHFGPYDGELRAFSFEYSLGEPVAGADVTVFRPDEQSSFQTGRTDARGVFAFAPDRPGSWRLEVRDGKGHAVRQVVNVGGAEQTPAADAPRAAHAWPQGLVLVLAASLLGNLLLGLLWLQERRAIDRSDTR